MNKLIKESGLRDIKALAQRYPKAKIYFHQDLDGVTTAIAMKKYLEDNGIDVVDSEVIQYGDKEFSVKKPDASGEVMPVLVDFAHGKPMFVIHTDHHDKQVGAEKDASKSFRQARSNVETISQVISPKELFPADDIRLISTVDSADFAKALSTSSMISSKYLRAAVASCIMAGLPTSPASLTLWIKGSLPSTTVSISSAKVCAASFPKI